MTDFKLDDKWADLERDHSKIPVAVFSDYSLVAEYFEKIVFLFCQLYQIAWKKHALTIPVQIYI